VLSLNQWYGIRVEFDCTTIASSTVVGTIDGAAWTSGGPFTISTAIARRQIGSSSSNIQDFYFDDLIIADGATSIDYRTRLIDVPVGSDQDTSLRGSQGTDWDTGPSTGGTAWQMVDEDPTPNDDTDYVELITNSTGTTDPPILDFGLVAPTTRGLGSGDSVVFVEVNIRHRAETGSNASHVVRLKGQSGGTLVESASLTYGAIAWMTNRESATRLRSRLLSETNPQGGVAWTPASVATAIIGVRAGDATPDIWVTKMWATVGFIAGAPGGFVPFPRPRGLAGGMDSMSGGLH
jgi:hypothetical protein